MTVASKKEKEAPRIPKTCEIVDRFDTKCFRRTRFRQRFHEEGKECGPIKYVCAECKRPVAVSTLPIPDDFWAFTYNDLS